MCRERNWTGTESKIGKASSRLHGVHDRRARELRTVGEITAYWNAVNLGARAENCMSCSKEQNRCHPYIRRSKRALKSLIKWLTVADRIAG